MRRQASSPRGQRGVTLIVALVMLVIIGLTSAAVMRGAMSSDLVANNSRLQTLAQQAAQIALRYCEGQLEAPVRLITVHKAAATEEQQAWRQFENWHGTDSYDIPAALVASEQSTFKPAKRPQCMAEESKAGVVDVFIVTARGFSPDYGEDSAGRTTTGSVVWLQSTVRVN